MHSESIHLLPSKLDKLFLHYFDIHFLEEKGRAVEDKSFRYEMELATRLAIASATTVFIPAASYFESPLCREVLHSIEGINDLIKNGLISLSGSSPNLEFFIQERQDIRFYREASHQFSAYHASGTYGPHSPPYVPRTRSATRDIATYWDSGVQDDRLPRMLRDAVGGPIPALEVRLERVPAELGALAFIPEHVYEILDLDPQENLVHARIRSIINEAYFASYVNDLEAGVVTDLRYIASTFRVPSAGRNLSYAKMNEFLRSVNELKRFCSCSAHDLTQYGNTVAWHGALERAVTYIERRVADVTNDGKPRLEGGGLRTYGLGTRHDDEPLPSLSCRVLCIAAAEVEFAAVSAHLDATFGRGTTRQLDSERKYYARRYVDQETSAEWYLVTQSFQGEVEATNNVLRLVGICKPTVTLMVGMCMGMPAHHLPVGTVVIPNEVFVFDHQRIKTSGGQYRPHGNRVDTGLHKLAKIVAVHGNLDFKVVSDKGLASASVKIEDQDADLVNTIHSSLPDVVAFDMEGWGFYVAKDGEDFLWIKAVADSGEPQGQSGEKRNEKQSTQACVTKNAADFAVRVVREFVAATSGS